MTARLMVVTCVLALTAAGNLALFQRPQADTAHPHRAGQRNEERDLIGLTEAHGANVRSRFSLYVWLSVHHPGATVELPPGHPVLVTALRGLAGAEVLTGDHDPWLSEETVHRLQDQASVRGPLSRGRRPDESRLRTGVPAAFERGSFAVIEPQDDDPSSRATPATTRFLAFWSPELVVLIEAERAQLLGLLGDSTVHPGPHSSG